MWTLPLELATAMELMRVRDACDDYKLIAAYEPWVGCGGGGGTWRDAQGEAGVCLWVAGGDWPGCTG